MEVCDRRVVGCMPSSAAFSFNSFLRSSVMDMDYIVALCSAVVLAGLFVLLVGGMV